MDRNNIISILNENKAYLFEKYGLKEIALFGSFAQNKHSEKSDIDIFIDCPKNVRNFDNYMDLKFFLEDKTGRDVDLTFKDTIRKEFLKDILAEAIYV